MSGSLSFGMTPARTRAVLQGTLLKPGRHVDVRAARRVREVSPTLWIKDAFLLTVASQQAISLP